MAETPPPGIAGEPPAPTSPPAQAAAASAASGLPTPGAPGWERAALERLLLAGLQEQRTARRWRTFVRLAWLGFFLLLFWALAFRGGPSTDKSLPHTAVIEIKG